jgi:nucleotide-binding universal stress UspA family protein
MGRLAGDHAVFRKVLVPIDLADPELAISSIETAVTLVRASGGSVRLLNVLPVTPADLATYVPADFDEQQRRTAEEALEIAARECGLDPHHVSVAVRQGGVHHEVIAEATAIGADLIVMSSHRPGKRAYFLGSNAAHVVRHAICSVLVVRR